MPRLSPRAFSRACPITMPTSSTVWWESTCKSPSASMSKSIRLWRPSRSSMWSKNPTPVWADASPEPSRFSETRTLVSFVCRLISAVRPLLLRLPIEELSAFRGKWPISPSEYVVCRTRLGGSLALPDLSCRDCRQCHDAGYQRVVFLAGSDGNADFIGQAGQVEVADENALFLEAQVRLTAFAVGSDGENEIRLAGQDRPAELDELGRDALALLFDVLPAAHGVFAVLDGRGGRGNGNRVAVVTVLHFHHLIDHLRMGDGVAEAEARQRIRLAERPRDNQVRAVCQQRNAVVLSEVRVRFVDQHRAVEPPCEFPDLTGLNERP